LATAGSKRDATEVEDVDGTLVETTAGGTARVDSAEEGGLSEDPMSTKVRASASVASFL